MMKNFKRFLCYVIVFFTAFSYQTHAQVGAEQTFIASDNCFRLNGQPFVVRAAELHYPRIPKAKWEERIRLCKAMGMNTICIYLFWNLHEQQEGVYNFEGQNNVAEFVKLIKKNGMYCIVRPGPYVCAEWDMGGLPWWLLKKEDIKVRSLEDKFFMESAGRYLKRVGKELSGLQIQKGGNIIMVQVENEYGVFGKDSKYMGTIRDLIRDSGFDKVQLFRCDWASNFDRYQLDGVASTLNFGAGSNVDEQFKKFKQVNPKAPLMCSEYWTGWFDQWGRPHETRNIDTFIGSLKDMLDKGISFSLYMAHGGTSFGQWAGANSPPYAPTVTSYDYDAPITEAGIPTDKFYAIRTLMQNYLNPGESIPEVPKTDSSIVKLSDITLTSKSVLFDNLPKPIISNEVRPMEYFGQGWGSILYRTTIEASSEERKLEIDAVHDYAMIYLDGKYLGKLDRRFGEKTITLPSVSNKATLDIYVETTGRVNYGKEIIDRKGITSKVSIFHGQNKVELANWKIYLFPLFTMNIDKLSFKEDKNPAKGPALYKGTFSVKETADTFLDLGGWGKGMVVVNGHNLGRFWKIGPTQTLFLPESWLKKGTNSIVVYDIYPKEKPIVKSSVKPIYEVVIDSSYLHRRNEHIDLSKATPAIEGTLPDAQGWKSISLNSPVSGRYICFEALNSQDKNDVTTSVAEFELIGSEGKVLATTLWKVVYADSEEITSATNSADKIFDKQESVIWQTVRKGGKSPHPHQVVIDLGESVLISGFKILPRSDNKKTGNVKDFRFYAQQQPFSFVKD